MLKTVLKLPTLLKEAIGVAKEMHYWHQNDIIYRGLKAANLLMDENEASFFFPKLLRSAFIYICFADWNIYYIMIYT